LKPILIRDPLWDTIRLDPVACRLVDSGAFQRLRYIRQLGLAHLVYPGATHTRFDHAVGVYHLAQRALAVLRARGHLDRISPLDCQLIPLAALLHDIGHYPYSHALEELEETRIPGHHEALVGRFLAQPEVDEALRGVAPDAARRVEALIRGLSDNPLRGLVSGSLDLDKIEYLKRDARFCGVPYGEVDVDRLLHALVVIEDPETGRPEMGVHEKGIASLESLLFAKYQMFRNVYWHHAVRAATVMYKRIVADALEAGLLDSSELVGQTDEGLLFLLERRTTERPGPQSTLVLDALTNLRARRLPKRAAEAVGVDVDHPEPAVWVVGDAPIKRVVEDRIAHDLGLAPGAVFLDYPEKSAMFHLNLLVQRRGGEVFRLGPGGRAGLIGLPRVADELYRTARVLRLFTLGGRRNVAVEGLARLAGSSEDEIQALLSSDAPLLEPANDRER
jgi:hypothetical protein